MTTAAAFAPVTYSLPFARLRRLSRRGIRRSYPLAFYLSWSWIGLYLIIFLLIGIFPPAFMALARSLAPWLGLSASSAGDLLFVLLIGLFLVGIFAIRRQFRAAQASRIKFGASITLAPNPAGLHIAGEEIEYIVKWAGIYELLREPDGVVLVCGGLFFLVPDSAFATAGARQMFLDHVAAHLTPEARARSETELQRARQS